MKVHGWLVFNSLFQISLCCNYGCEKSWAVFYHNHVIVVDLDTHPYSTTVADGSIAVFTCEGYGSHLYWYIDGVNTDSMSNEEIVERGISFDGWYNNYPPYYWCDIQDSYLYMDGNCYNNNSQIHCVILDDVPPPDGGNTTSNIATLTVEGTIHYAYFI